MMSEPDIERRERRVLFFENVGFLAFCALVTCVLLFRDRTEPFVLVVLPLALFIFAAEKAYIGNSLSFTNLTVPSLFISAYIGIMCLPSVIIFETMIHPIRYTYFMAIQSVVVVFPVGVHLCNVVSNSPEIRIRNHFSSPLEATAADRAWIPMLKALVCASVPILFVYVVSATYIQLWEVIKQYPTNIEKSTLRFAANDLPRSVHFLFELLRRLILPLCVLYAYFMSRATGAHWHRVFRILLVYTFVVCSLTLDRAPPIALVVLVVFAYMTASNRSLVGMITSLRSLAAILVMGIIGGFISILQYQSDFEWNTFFGNIWYVISYRIVQDPSYMAAAYSFQIFDEPGSMLHGNYVRLFSILPGREYLDTLLSDDPRNPVAPVSFVGDLWRNWGWAGVIIGTLTIGFLYQFAQLRLSDQKNVVNSTLQVILLLNSVWIIPGNALGTVSTSVLALVLVLTYVTRPKAQGSRPATA